MQLPEISQLRIAMRTLSVVPLLHFLLLNAKAQLDDTIPLTEDEIVYPYVPPICEQHVPLMFAYSDKRCGCFWQPENGLQDGSQATPCSSSFLYYNCNTNFTFV